MIKTKKISKKLFIVFPVVLFLAVYLSLPEKVTVTKGEKINFNFGMSANADTDKTGDFSSTIKLFNIIPIKTVSVSVTPAEYVVPSGETIGVRLHTDGILVLGTGNVSESGGTVIAPAKKAGIKKGDRIIAVNNLIISDTLSLKNAINNSCGNVVITVERGDKVLDLPTNAVFSEENGTYQIGAWVKDSAAGIGTLTFYYPKNNSFAALGHGICDADTDSLLKIKDGSVSFCAVRKIEKSKNGKPGEILGDFTSQKLGKLLINSDVGIYGKSSAFSENDSVAVASRFELEKGAATLLCDIDGEGAKEYQIDITKIFKSPKSPNKCFVFKVSDSALIEKTGGIVQGMSGSPILQNGKFVGAVTHVFVNNSLSGYGIFAENMLDIAAKIK